MSTASRAAVPPSRITPSKWAATAVALGTEDADAYVLIGHSERRGGHREEAIAAYRRYLDASPNGWHARHVRAALRALQPRLVVR